VSTRHACLKDVAVNANSLQDYKQWNLFMKRVTGYQKSVTVHGSEVDKEITLVLLTHDWPMYYSQSAVRVQKEKSRFAHNTISAHIYTSSCCRWWLSVPEEVGWSSGNLKLVAYNSGQLCGNQLRLAERLTAGLVNFTCKNPHLLLLLYLLTKKSH